MSNKLSKAPVYHTLAQARFNPIANMENYINKIQDKLRIAGYTLFESQKVTQLHFNASSSAIPNAVVVELPVWSIIKPDRSAGFILGQTSLDYHTTHYQTHVQFFNEFLSGLQIIHSMTHLDHLSRLGLRYLNAILPLKKETVNQYLVDGLHGMELNTKPRYSLIESVFDTVQGSLNGILISRIHRRKGPLGYPPDMVPNGLITLPQFAITESISHAVIDIDHYTEDHTLIDFEQIRNNLTSLHSGITSAFQATITTHARERWA